MVDSLRLRALRSMLYKDAAYFDTPSTSPAVTVTRISIDAPNIKAVGNVFNGFRQYLLKISLN